MALLAALFAFGSRFVGKVLTTALGWAATLLFGRVPASRQYLLLGLTFGSVIWVVLLVGVLLPAVGTFILVLVPSQDFIPESTVRLVMLVAALIVPGILGAITLRLAGSAGGRSPGQVVRAVVRGYPLTLMLSVLLVFLAALAIFRRVRGMIRRWSDAHVPLVVLPGHYDEVAADLDSALAAAGIEVEAKDAPAYMSTPARWLARIAGSDAAALVPERMIQLVGEHLDILIYPMDVLISGQPDLVVRARAAIASRLTTSAAHLTVSAEAQAIEDRLRALAGPGPSAGAQVPPFDDAVLASLGSIDEALATIKIPYEEWEVLYRQRLQVERDLRAGWMAGEAVIGASTAEAGDGREGSVARLEELGRALRDGAAAVLEAATDKRTLDAIDHTIAPGASLPMRVAIVVAVAARSFVRSRQTGSADVPAGPPEPEPEPAAPKDRTP